MSRHLRQAITPPCFGHSPRILADCSGFGDAHFAMMRFASLSWLAKMNHAGAMAGCPAEVIAHHQPPPTMPQAWLYIGAAALTAGR